MYTSDKYKGQIKSDVLVNNCDKFSSKLGNQRFSAVWVNFYPVEGLVGANPHPGNQHIHIFAGHLQWFLAEFSVSKCLEKIAFGGHSASVTVALVEASEIVAVYI